MDQRQTCIARFRDDMAYLLSVVAALPLEPRQQPLDGDWTAKDVLAHIAAWDRELVPAVDELLAGRYPSFIAEDVDAFNTCAVAAARDLPWDAVLAELRGAHEALIARTRALTDDEWRHLSRHTWRDGTPMTVASLFAYTYQGETHYRGHAQELTKTTW